MQIIHILTPRHSERRAQLRGEERSSVASYLKSKRSRKQRHWLTEAASPGMTVHVQRDEALPLPTPPHRACYIMCAWNTKRKRMPWISSCVGWCTKIAGIVRYRRGIAFLRYMKCVFEQTNSWIIFHVLGNPRLKIDKVLLKKKTSRIYLHFLF